MQAPPKEAYTTHQVTKMFQVKKLRYVYASSFNFGLLRLLNDENLSSMNSRGTKPKKMQMVKCQYQERESKSADNKLKRKKLDFTFINDEDTIIAFFNEKYLKMFKSSQII